MISCPDQMIKAGSDAGFFMPIPYKNKKAPATISGAEQDMTDKTTCQALPWQLPVSEFQRCPRR
jgi:hypothetical protein